MYFIGQILTTKELVEDWGTAEQIYSYKNNKKLGTRSKQAILREVATMMELEQYKVGREVRYKVIDIYKEHHPKQDGRRKNNTYVDALEFLILHELNNRKDTIIYVSNSNLYEPLGFFNEKFKELNYSNDTETCEKLLVDYLTLKSFKITSKAEANRIINRVLKSMKDRKLINYIQGKMIVGQDATIRIASIEENSILTKLEKETLNEIGCRSHSHLEFKNLKAAYNRKLKEKIILSGEISNYDYMYEGYCIISHKEVVMNEIKQKEKQEKFIVLNNLFQDKLGKTFETKHLYATKRLEEQTEFGTGIEQGEASKEYLKQTKKLMDIYSTIQ